MNYKRPGVYIEESLTPLAQAAADPGEAAAAFVGALPQGPTRPTKVSSWSAFNTLYGGFGDGRNYTPFAVYQYFNNGGRAAWIVRAVASDAVAASVTLEDRQTDAADGLKVSAVSKGGWGNGVNVSITDSGTGTGRFTLTVFKGGTTESSVVERWADLSLDQGSGRYAPSIINSPVSGSSYVSLTNLHASEAYDVTFAPALVANQSLASGADGAAALDLAASAATLEQETLENLVLNVPGVTDSVTLSPVINWAESTGRVFVVVDLPKQDEGDTSSQTQADWLSAIGGLPVSSYAAPYGPWLSVDDPSSLVAGSTRLLPPGGAVMGQYSRTDASSGVQKPPAGLNANLRGVLDVQVRFKPSEEDALYDKGVNIIKPLPGSGICIWGARTLKPGNPDRYVSVRRSLIMIKKALQDNTRFAVFEPNNDALWTRIEAVIAQYLLTLQQSGVLKGSTPDEAFFVKCDSENNTASTAQQGIVNIEVGVALSSPAEFVIIKIGQFEGGTSAVETENA